MYKLHLNLEEFFSFIFVKMPFLTFYFYEKINKKLFLTGYQDNNIRIREKNNYISDPH